MRSLPLTQKDGKLLLVPPFTSIVIVVVCLYRKGKLKKCCKKNNTDEQYCACCLNKPDLCEMNDHKSSEKELSEDGRFLQGTRLEGTKLEDPNGYYSRALRDGKTLYDEDEDF